MIISRQKPIAEIISSLLEFENIFLIGCGECATACKSGGGPEVLLLKATLEKQGKVITGFCLPSAPCVAAKIKTELAKNISVLKATQAILVLACGLGVQSVKDNLRQDLAVLPANDTTFGAVMDAQGNFFEKCSLCGECVLAQTGGICPTTLCAKGLLNGPCGGMHQGKCEVDKDKDCAWILIYRALQKSNNLEKFKKIQAPKDNRKSSAPRNLIFKK